MKFVLYFRGGVTLFTISTFSRYISIHSNFYSQRMCRCTD